MDKVPNLPGVYGNFLAEWKTPTVLQTCNHWESDIKEETYVDLEITKKFLSNATFTFWSDR